MNPLRSILTGALALLAAAITTAQDARPAPDGAPAGSHFQAVDITIDTGDKPLAAYQFEFTAGPGSPRITLVGVEGGEHAAFSAAPYYDPKALAGDRVIVAAFSTSANLPSGKTRVARLHLRVEGPGQPEYQVTLSTSADSDGKRIEATAAAAASGENR